MDSLPTSASAATSATNSLDGRGVSGGGSDFLNIGMFGHPSGVGDLLLGTSGFGGSLASAYGNDSGGSSSVTSSGVPGSTGSSAFDINDFPSLGGSGGNIGGSASSNGLAVALRQQQQQQQQQALAHQQMLQGASKNANTANLYRLAMQSGANGGPNFTMATEDFPALPGAPVGAGSNGLIVGQVDSSLLLGANGISGLSLATTGSSFGAAPVSRSTGAGGLYGGDMDNAGSQMDGGLLSGAGLGGLGALQLGPSNQGSSLLQQRSATLLAPGGTSTGLPSAPGVTSVAGSALGGDYGLLGLLSVIRMTDADRNALALGTDLSMLGMNLNSSDSLYTNFASPWSEGPATKEPHYRLPMCYYVQPPALKTGHLSKFQLETLFYIFYALPKDVLQAYSAQELYSREWRYHVDLKRWFKRASPADGVANSASGAPQFLYFDINTWERRLFSGNLQNLTTGFLTEEDVRVKFSNS